MGLLCAKPSNGNGKDNFEDAMMHHIEQQRGDDESKVKLLLLGAGESGKSTLFKQMKINYVTSYQVSDLIDEREKIIQMFFQSFFDLVTAICDQNGTLGSPELDEMKENVYPNGEKKTRTSLTQDVVQFVHNVWESESAQEVWENRNNFQITDSLGYFCDAIERLAAPDYRPTEMDYLRCRVISTGIVEQTFMYNKMKFVIVDVGGQRSERKKWIQCFDGVNAVLFVIAISEFDQKLFEDTSVDRMTEARTLFQSTLKFRVFREKDFILFLNKEDLLKEKLTKLEEKGVDLDKYFPQLNMGTNYTGAYDKICRHYKQEFTEMGRGRVYTHFTNATDKGAFDKVFKAAAQIILNNTINDHFGH